MASPLVSVKFHSTLATGADNASGKIYTYAAGTLTPLATYTDYAGGTPNANPVILDSTGRASIYLNSSVAYKFISQDSTGATVPDGTVDHFSAGVTYADLSSGASSAIGAGMVGIGMTITTYPAGSVGDLLTDALGLHPAEIAASITPTNYAFPVLDIRRYGAVEGDATDCSSAFASAYKVAAYFVDDVSAAHVLIPDGTYLVTADNFLGQFDFSSFAGGNPWRFNLTVKGNGWGSCIHWKPTGNTAKWLYDNGVAASTKNCLINPTIQDLRIIMDVTGTSAGATLNGFYEAGSANYATQGFRFKNVNFECVDYPGSNGDIAKAGVLVKARGSVNSDLTSFVQCRVRGLATLLDVDVNNESVMHRFTDTDAEVMYSDVFKIAAGNSLKFDGGSITMMSQSANSYLLAYRPTTNAVPGTITFANGRLELNSNQAATYYSRLLDVDISGQAYFSGNPSPVINFDNFNFYPTSGAARHTIKVDAAAAAVINFNGCDGLGLGIHQIEAWTSEATLDSVSAGPFSTVNFINGTSVQPANVFYTDAFSFVHVTSRNCSSGVDYDLAPNGQYGVRAGISVPLKTARLFGSVWPDVGTPTAISTLLPPYAIIKAVRFRKIAGGAGGTNYQLKMTDNSSGPTYAQSTLAFQNLLHEAQADNLNIVADTSTKQTVALIATTTGTAQATRMALGDYAMVDYY